MKVEDAWAVKDKENILSPYIPNFEVFFPQLRSWEGVSVPFLLKTLFTLLIQILHSKL